MAGKNPYLKETPKTEIKRSYALTIRNSGQRIVVDPEKVPYGGTGIAGSILDVALSHGVDIDHACGGVCACSTCHVYIESGEASCSQASDGELDMLDLAPNVKPNSRLACQCVPDGSSDVVIEIPPWNRNLVRE